jgi:hypothetical protein
VIARAVPEAPIERLWCRRCGYDLSSGRGTRGYAGKCPECGEPTSRAATRTGTDVDGGGWLRAGLHCGLLPRGVPLPLVVVAALATPLGVLGLVSLLSGNAGAAARSPAAWQTLMAGVGALCGLGPLALTLGWWRRRDRLARLSEDDRRAAAGMYFLLAVVLLTAAVAGVMVR